MELRPYTPADLPGIYHVCAVTDATGRTSPPAGDRALSGHLYAAPYAVADPSLAVVLDSGGEVAGYAVATADILEFRDWAEANWWPTLRALYPAIATDQSIVEPWHRTHPAEMHLKVLDGTQGQGWGRRLALAALDRLRERGAPGVHLGVAATNLRALSFWRSLGFAPVREHDWGVTLTLDL